MVRLLYQKNNKISSRFARAKESSTYEKSSFINFLIKIPMGRAVKRSFLLEPVERRLRLSIPQAVGLGVSRAFELLFSKTFDTAFLCGYTLRLTLQARACKEFESDSTNKKDRTRRSFLLELVERFELSTC